MKKFLIPFIGIFLAEIVTLIIFAVSVPEFKQDAVKVNAAVKSAETYWNEFEKIPSEGIDFVITDTDGVILYKTKDGLSESLNEAVVHGDTILDIGVDGVTVGKMIIRNRYSESTEIQRNLCISVIAVLLAVQCAVGAVYVFYLNARVAKPFRKLNNFALRVAGGNLDIPLEMDRGNVFGAFTESFDIMRSELKKARIAEARANESKKELVAKLSHDIKTPLASIKAASEVGYALTKDKKTMENFSQIIIKADQINTLVNNLFSATLEELQQLNVTPEYFSSGKIVGILKNSDYLQRADIHEIPVCLVYADALRLQQVFDNIFANSYKYADTRIEVVCTAEADSLSSSVEDFGGGVEEDELPLVTEKYMRGKNASDKDGAGLGLYISDYFMKEMDGELKIENGEKGLKVTVKVKLAGKN